MRVVDAEAGPCAGLFALFAKGFGFAFPNAILVDLGGEFLFGLAVEEVPFQIVFADMILAEPIELFQIVW